MAIARVVCLACGCGIEEGLAKTAVLVNKTTPRYVHTSNEACMEALRGETLHGRQSPISTMSVDPLDPMESWG